MNTPSSVIAFAPDGRARCLWTEAVALRELGALTVQRASTIEFDSDSQAWEVRLASAPEAVAFSNPSREACLDWERNQLNALL